MIDNKYCILNLPDNALNNIISHNGSVCQNIDNIRYNSDGKKCVIKLKLGFDSLDILGQSVTYLTHSQIISELENSEWI